MYIDWTDDLSVGVAEIDQQHKRFLVIINDLYETLENKNEKTALGDIISQLASYAMFHFMTEEKYMDAFHYEGTEAHKKQHEILKERIVVFGDTYANDPEKQAQELLHFLKDYLADHLMKMDHKYMKCFKEHGLQ
jgi:hemerythrin